MTRHCLLCRVPWGDPLTTEHIMNDRLWNDRCERLHEIESRHDTVRTAGAALMLVLPLLALVWIAR